MTILPTQRLAAWFGALNSLHVGRGTEWVVHATGAVVGREARHEFLQGVPRLAPSGKDIRDDFYGRRSHLSEFYIASRLSLNSLPFSFEKISCFVQLPDKLFDLRNRWSANLLNKWCDIRVGLGRRRRVWVNSIVASGFHNRRSFPSCGTPITPLRAPAAVLIPKHKSGKARIATGIISQQPPYRLDNRN